MLGHTFNRWPSIWFNRLLFSGVSLHDYVTTIVVWSQVTQPSNSTSWHTVGWRYRSLYYNWLIFIPNLSVMRAMITYSQDTHISYITHSYTTLRVKGTILRWPLVPLSMHRKSSDHLKVTWYIVRLKKIWSTKISRGEGFRLSAHGLYVYDEIKGNCVRTTNYLRSIKAFNEKIPTTHLPPPLQASK